jgi:hypothetical protein
VAFSTGNYSTRLFSVVMESIHDGTNFYCVNRVERNIVAEAIHVVFKVLLTLLHDINDSHVDGLIVFRLVICSHFFSFIYFIALVLLMDLFQHRIGVVISMGILA